MIKLKEIANGWEKEPEWWGNPSLGLTSYKKIFINKMINRAIPVYVFGEEGDIHFVVRAGAHSDYSYTGGFPEKNISFEHAMEYVDKLYDSGKLFR